MGRRELDREEHDRHEVVERTGPLVGVPADPRGERLRLEVEMEGGEIAPGPVSAREFDRARGEHQTEEQPPEEKDGELRGRGCARARSPPEAAGVGQEDGEESRFDEQRVHWNERNSCPAAVRDR